MVWIATLMLAGATPVFASDDDRTPASPPDAAQGAIHVYQRYLSDLRHTRCRFVPSCSEYAAQAIARYGLVDGSARAADRLMRCNASAAGAYPRGESGALLDPVGDEPAPTGLVRAPGWLRLSAGPDRPPSADTLDAGRRARLDETVAFARRLEASGERANAAIEYRRAGLLAAHVEADAWAFEQIGAAATRAGDALGAESAELTAAMLTADETHRARAVYRAALARFDGGSFAASERLLADRTLMAAAADSSVAVATGAPDGARIEALGGLANMGLGDWDQARTRFERARSLARDDVTRGRIERLLATLERGPRLPHRSSTLAVTMSAVIPGSGQMYAGRGADGMRHLLFNAVMILTTISFARGDHVPAAVLTGALAVPFYVGNLRGARESARQFDRRHRLELLGQAIDDSAR